MPYNRGSSSETFPHLYTRLCFILWKGINHTTFSCVSSPKSCWEQENVFRKATGWWATGSKTAGTLESSARLWELLQIPVGTLSCFALLCLAIVPVFPYSLHLLLPQACSLQASLPWGSACLFTAPFQLVFTSFNFSLFLPNLHDQPQGFLFFFLLCLLCHLSLIICHLCSYIRCRNLSP